jgi:hypothetical protein
MSLTVLPAISRARVQATAPETLRCDLQDRLKAVALAGRMAPPRRFVPERDGFWDDYAYEIDPAFPELAERIARHRLVTVQEEQEDSCLPPTGLSSQATFG